MADPKREAGFISQILQFNPEQAHRGNHLEPPPSAVIINWLASGQALALSMTSSQRLIELTANPVRGKSLLMPRFTQAALAAMS